MKVDLWPPIVNENAVYFEYSQSVLLRKIPRGVYPESL